MSTTDAVRSELARRAANARWGDQVLRRSVVTVLERADLADTTRAELEQIAGDPAGDGDDAA